MPEKVTFVEQEQYIYVESYGKITLKDIEDSIRTVNCLHQQFKSNQLVVDVRQQKQALTLLEAFSLARKIWSVIPNSIKLAYIVCPSPLKEQLFFKKISNKI